MKFSLKALIVLVFALITFGAAAQEASPTFKMGFVDFEKVFNSYNKTKEENDRLQTYKGEKERKAQSLLDEINRLKGEADILSEEAKAKAQKHIRDKLRDLRDFTEDSKKELLDERNTVFKKITDEIRALIAKIGEKKEFTLIFDDKALFYKKDALDLTDEIIAVINDKEKIKEYQQ